jgi:hypothetical protein
MALVSLLYDSTVAYEADYTYYGVGNGISPVIKVEMDLSSSFPTEVLDIDYGGVLAYTTSSEYDPADRYDGFVEFDDITSSVRSIEITRGKSSLTYDHFDAGTCSLEISDFNSTFLPDEPLSPYYPNIKPLRQVRISATWSGETFVLYRGFVDAWQIRWQPKQEFTDVGVQTTDATKLLANFETEYTGVDGDYAWERVGDMLLDKSWPADFTDVDTDGWFASLVEDTSDRRQLLPNLQEYEIAEQGALFVSKEGRITWRNQAAANPLEAQTADYFFSDTGGAGYITMTEIDYTVSDEKVYNVISITPTLGTEQVASNSDSIDEYRERALTLTDVPLTTDLLADQLAQIILDKQKLPLSRINSVTTDPRTSVHSSAVALRGDMLTRIDVIRTPPGGTTNTYKMFVIGIRHSITPESWATQFVTDYRGDLLVFP